MRKPKLIKRQKARNAEYYDMQRTQDDLDKRSLNNQNFIKPMLVKAVPVSEFGYPNSVLAKAAEFSICRLQGLSLPRFLRGVTAE